MLNQYFSSSISIFFWWRNGWEDKLQKWKEMFTCSHSFMLLKYSLEDDNFLFLLCGVLLSV